MTGHAPFAILGYLCLFVVFSLAVAAASVLVAAGSYLIGVWG